MTVLYVPERPSPFLNMAHDEGLITLTPVFVQGQCMRIKRNLPCACSHPLVVQGRTITVPKGDSVMGHPSYALPLHCTLEEQLTVVTWLTRGRFLSFGMGVEEILPKRKDGKPNNTITRDLTPNKTFRMRPHPTCHKCEVFDMVKDPVFCLKGIVMSVDNKGPTVESVLNVQ